MSLSDKIGYIGVLNYNDIIHKKDVKEFIKELRLDLCTCTENGRCPFCNSIDRRAGGDLI